MNEKVSVLQVDNLSVAFSMYNKGLSKRDLEVIHELSIDVKKGEIVAVVGSSGSGKSLLAHAIMGILPENAKTGFTSEDAITIRVYWEWNEDIVITGSTMPDITQKNIKATCVVKQKIN